MLRLKHGNTSNGAIERSGAEILKEADLSTINVKELCSRAYNIELVDVFANTLDSSTLKLAVKRRSTNVCE